MNIFYLSQSPLDKKPANAIHVMNMCSAFVELGHNVVLFARGNEKSDKRSVFESFGLKETFKIVISQGFGKGRLSVVSYSIPVLWKIRRLSKKQGSPDLIYARCIYSAFLALILGLKVSVEFHELPESRILKLLYGYILRSKGLRHIVVISKALENDLRKEFSSIAHKRVTVAHDGANVEPISPSDFFKRKKISLPNGAVVGYAGGLREGNGIGLLISLANINPGTSFVIVGGAKEEVDYWKRQSESSNIYWLGRQEPGEIKEFLCACDILVAPYQVGPKTAAGKDTSRWMSPLKVFEYMSARKPIIISDFPVLREVLDDRAALFVSPDSLEEWNCALAKLMGSPDLRGQLANNAYHTLEKRYTWKRRADSILNSIFCAGLS